MYAKVCHCSIDYGPLLGHKSGVVKEILFMGHKKAQIVLNHPVMETYLQVVNIDLYIGK